MVTRRSLLKAAAAGSVAMLAPLAQGATRAAADDVPAAPGILASLSYSPEAVTPPISGLVAWTPVPVARVTFDAPASGSVLLGIAAAVRTGGGSQGYWRVTDAVGGPVPGSEQLVTVSPVILRISSRVLIEGLEPASPQDWTLEQRTTVPTGPISIFAGMAKNGLSYGPLTMVVMAA